MLKGLKAECLKEKGSSNRRLIMVVPLVFILFCGCFTFLMIPSTDKFTNFIAIVYNWFPLMLTPILLSLISSAVIIREDHERLTDFHRSLLVEPKHIWLAKISVASADFILIYLAVLVLSLLTEGLAFGKTDYLGLIALNAVVLLILNIGLIPFSMWLCRLTNPFVVIVTNFLLTFVSLPVASTNYWWLSPWVYGFRTTAALLGIHPNGTFLPSDSPLLDQLVVPKAVLIGTVLLVATSYLSTIFYERSVTGK